MNTQQLFHHHLELGRQNNKCADILKIINQAKSQIESIWEWLKTSELDCKVPQSYINSKLCRLRELESKVIPRLLSYYQSELIKLEQIYRA